MIAIADSNANGLLDYHISAFKETGAKHMWPGRVHGGGANVLFCDGHVTRYPQEELLVGEADRRLRPSNVRRWNNDHGLGE